MTTLLLHDWEMVRQTITNLIPDDISVTSDISTAMKLARSGGCDVALVDVSRYGAAVRGLARHLSVIGLVTSSGNPSANRALLNGALVVLPLNGKIGELREVVKKAKKGTLEAEKGKEVVIFTERQEDVLRGIMKGLNAPQIAEELNLGVGWIRNLTRQLYEVVGVDGGGRFTARGRLVRWAMENGYD